MRYHTRLLINLIPSYYICQLEVYLFDMENNHKQILKLHVQYNAVCKYI